MSTIVDKILAVKYKEMCGFYNIINVSDNTTLLGSITILSSLYTSSNTAIHGSESIMSSFYINNKSFLKGNNTFNSNLFISGLSNINNNLTINSSLNIFGNSNINGNLYINNGAIFQDQITILSGFNVGGDSIITNLETETISPYDQPTLNIIGDTINIGSTNSIIYMRGTTNYIANTKLSINDNLIMLNIDTNNNPIDDGINAGFEILGSSGNGFIKTTEDGLRYYIKAPNDSITRYIATLDGNENLTISGHSLFYKDVTVNSTLFVSDKSIFNNDATMNLNLNVLGDTIINNNATILSNIYISNNTNIHSDTTTNMSLNVLNNSIIPNTIVNADLVVMGNTNLLSDTTIYSSLNLYGNSDFLTDVTIKSSLNISSNTILNNDTTIKSNLYISGNSLMNGNANINSTLLVSGNSILSSNVSINSKLNINGNSLLKGDVSIGTTTTKLNILGKITCNLKEYPINSTAAANGIPLYGFYRTGGIVKIRVDVVAPTITLIGDSSINLTFGNVYMEPGIVVSDNVDTGLNGYIISIENNITSNIIYSPLLVSNNLYISGTELLPSGQYTITYKSTDATGNEGYNTRTLVVL